MKNLFTDLERALSTEEGREHLAKRYGRQTCDMLVAVSEELILKCAH